MRARGWGCGELSRERHRAADRGRGAAGAGQSRPGSPGRSWCWGPRSAMGPAPCSAGTNPAEHHPRGRILVEAGGVPHRPLAAEPDRDGPRRMDTGGAGGAGHRGSEARVPVVRGPARGRPGGPWGCGWGGEGREGCAGSGPNPEWPPGAGRGPPRAAAPWGGGGCSLPGGRRGPLLSEGGGRACIARCRAMSIHGRAAWDYIPNPPRRSPFFGGAEGGGGAGGCCVHPPMRGGVAGGSSVWHGRKNPVASPGLVGPFEEEPRICRGGLRYMVWYGMVWYGMVWYGMVWYGMLLLLLLMLLLLLLLLLLLWRSARAGGKKCQTRSPRAERKGAVRRRYAGQAGAADDRGGEGGRR